MDEEAKIQYEVNVLNKAVWIVAIAFALASSPSVEGQALKTTRLTDGTGTVGVAPGWKVSNSYRGSVDVTGPQGAAVRLGIPWAITNPIDPVTGMQSIAAGQAATANVGDINTALQQVLAFNGGGRLQKLSRRKAKSAIPGIPAWMMCYDFTANGKPYTAVAYVTSLTYGQTSPVWSLYTSAVVAPKAVFWKMFPTMLKIWGSWRPNGKEPDAGSASALADGIIKSRWASAEKNHLYFREYVLGNPKASK